MAITRRNAQLREDVKSLIDTKRLVKRLVDHVDGKAMLDKSQVSAALGLLRKTLPDLANVEVSGDADNPISYVIKAPDQLPDATDWQSRYTSHPHGPN